MTDSAAVFPPGYRLTDSQTGAPIIGATLEFYDAGTTNPKTMYADAALSVELGTTVTTDSLGCPTSNGTAKTDVYVDTAPYKIVIKDATGTIIETKDNRPGAVATTAPSDTSVISTRPVVTKSLDYTILPAEQSTIFAGNCSSGVVDFTLPSAADVGSGWYVTIQHAGSANQCVLKTVSSQTITEGDKSFGVQYVLVFNGEDLTLVSDGGNWRVVEHTPPSLKPGQGVLTVVSRLATPPDTPTVGDLYILLASPTAAWSGFAEHDLALWNGAAWVDITPRDNGGLIAWVQAETAYYVMNGGWGPLILALEGEGRVAVAWGLFDGTQDPPTLGEVGNITGVSRSAAGIYLVPFDTGMAEDDFAVVVTAEGGSSASEACTGWVSDRTTEGITIRVAKAGSFADAAVSFAIFGDIETS